MPMPALLAGTRPEMSATSLPTSLGRNRVRVGNQLHRITHLYARKQILHILIAHPDASVRCRLADGLRTVRPMNAVTLVAQPHPSRAQRIRGSRRNNFSRLIPGRPNHAARNMKTSVGAGSAVLANRNGVNLHHL